MVFGGQKTDLVVFLSKSVILRSGGVSASVSYLLHYRSPSPLRYCPCVRRGSGVRGEETRETCTGGGHGKNGFGFNSKHVKREGVELTRRGGQGLVTILGPR